MKLYIVLILSFMLLYINPQTLSPQSEKKNSNLANVAILNYTNNTGKDEYNWLQNSLPSAVFDSMVESFVFNKTDSQEVENISRKRFKAGKAPVASDLAYLAEHSKSDIVIFGEYEFDQKKNIILIKTKIFHASRKEITSVINIESKTDATLFNVVDKVASQIVAHITVIAKEDIEKSEKIKKKKEADKIVKKADKDKEIAKKDELKVEKKEKIVLQKAGDSVHFSKVYIDLSGVFYSPLFLTTLADFPYSQYLYGGGLRASITNSLSDFFIFGGVLNLSVRFFDKNFPLFEADIQPIIGLNWNINNKVFIQPYVSFGIGIFTASFHQMSIYQKYTFSRYVPSITLIGEAGIKVPIRIGRDLFLTPFIGFSYFMSPGIVGTIGGGATINAGIGFCF